MRLSCESMAIDKKYIKQMRIFGLAHNLHAYNVLCLFQKIMSHFNLTFKVIQYIFKCNTIEQAIGK